MTATRVGTGTALGLVLDAGLGGGDDMHTLDEPLDLHGRQVGDVVAEVTWTATGDGVRPGEFEEFELSLGPTPVLTVDPTLGEDPAAGNAPAEEAGPVEHSPLPRALSVAAGPDVTPGPGRLRTALAGLAALATLTLGACSADTAPEADGGAAPSTTAPPAGAAEADPRFDSYVALGDSFTAGPYVPVTDLAGGCFRSSGNYPSLVAERLDIPDVTDVSCSGAATRHLFRPQHPVENSTVPPQLDALDADTDLVTVGIGGNDFNLFSTLVVRCTRLRAVDPSGDPCTDTFAAEGTDLRATTDRIGRRVARVLRAVGERAPEATVLLVGYLRLVPTDGGCPAAGLADGDYAMAHDVTRALNAALERAARRTGVPFVDMFAASAGHDICSEQPWVQGRRTDQQEAFAYHPLASGMEAVASRIVARLR